MAWELDGRAETLNELIGLMIYKRAPLAKETADGLLEEEGGCCDVVTVIGLGRLLGRHRHSRTVKTITRKTWNQRLAQFPEERWVENDLMIPLVRTDRMWVLDSSYWITKHTMRLACYWALRLDGPADLWEVCYRECWKRHGCGLINERTCGCYRAGLASYGLAKAGLIV